MLTPVKEAKMNPTKPRAYSYIRMSTSQQIKGDSLRRQLEMSRAFADEHGLELDDRLRDIGVSAWKGDNRKKGALGEFLNLVKTGQVQPGSYLLIESLDRLSRDQVLEALSLFLELLQAEIVVVTMADRQIYSQASIGSDWTKLIISLTVMARAHEESARKSQRVREAFASKRKMIREGRKTLVPSLPAWIDQIKSPNGDVTFTLNRHALTVRRIFEMAAMGMGQRQIARRLNEENHPTFRDGTPGWHQPTISGVLENVAVIGAYRAGKAHRDIPDADVIVPDYFPAAVSDDLYAKAQRMRRQRPSKGRKGTTFSNLFTGMGVCEHCFGTMVIKVGGYVK
jgi:DNA invertase Pin-like site-specific DNA recombinase